MSKRYLGVIYSTNSWNWEDVNRKWFFENGIVGRIQLEKLFVQQRRIVVFCTIFQQRMSE